MRAFRNGFANSQLAPIPLNSNSGGPPPLPCLIATWSNWPSIVICRTSISPGFPVAAGFVGMLPLVKLSVKDVGPRSWSKGGMALAAGRGRRIHLFA